MRKNPHVRICGGLGSQRPWSTRPRIRELRIAKGWTQERLAEAARLDRAYFASLVLGLRNPSFRTLIKLGRGLGVPLSRLCDID